MTVGILTHCIMTLSTNGLECDTQHRVLLCLESHFNGTGTDSWYDDTLHNDIKHNGLECDTQPCVLLCLESHY
jgi:hypothetical protein